MERLIAERRAPNAERKTPPQTATPQTSERHGDGLWGGGMRRVAFLSEHASPVALLGGQDAGGQNVYVDEVSRNLAHLGYQVDVFTRREDADDPEVIEWAPGVRVVNLRAGPAHVLPKDALWPLMPAFRDNLLDFIARDGAHYELIHGNFWMSGWVGAELGERLGLPVVQIFHAVGKTKQRHQGEADTSPAVRLAVEHEVIRRVDRLIAQCPEELRELVEDYAADPAKIVVIPSAVNTERFQPVARDEAQGQIGFVSADPVVVYVGRMLPRKDVRNLLRAAAQLIKDQLPDLRVLLVGGETVTPDRTVTPEIGVLQDLADELGIAGQVTFMGKRQPDELRYYYSAGDVVVTTPWYEPFGLTPLEGMACGRPVVGSAVGGISYTIADGQTGLLVPPRAPKALAAALARLLRNTELRARMGQAARKRVEHEFTWPTVAERTAALYQAISQRQAIP